jgi:cytochrome bd-type quinol oxidase subunit 2
VAVGGGDGARQGRAVRTALLGFVAAGIGTNVFEDVQDPWLTALPFVFMTLLTGALYLELTNQSGRTQRDTAPRWARTDTAILAILLGYAVLLSIAAALRYLPADEQTAAVCFAALYVVLAAYFARWRRKTIAEWQRPLSIVPRPPTG